MVFKVRLSKCTLSGDTLGCTEDLLMVVNKTKKKKRYETQLNVSIVSTYAKLLEKKEKLNDNYLSVFEILKKISKKFFFKKNKAKLAICRTGLVPVNRL
jgi:hypothetical protein